MRKAAAAAVVLLLLCLTGCDLFSTREAEDPVNQQSSWVIPLEADQVLTNIQASVYEQHLDNFMQSLIDTAFSSVQYQFEPDAEVAAAYDHVFAQWSRASEAVVMQQVFSLALESGDVYLELQEAARENPAPQQMIWTGNYQLVLEHQVPNLPAVFKGQLIFYLETDQRGYWAIARWVDHAAVNNPGWSGLKAALGG